MRAERGSLLTLGAAVFLPLILFVVLQTAFGLQMQRRQVENEALAQAREVTALIDGQLWADHSALLVASGSVAIKERDFKTAHSRIGQLDQERPRWVNVVLTDAISRREIWETASPFGQFHPLRPEIAAYLDGGALGGPIAGMASGGSPCPCLVIHEPVLEDGKLRFVLTGLIDTRDFQNILRADTSRDAVSAVVDRKGLFVARTLDFAHKLGRPATPYVRNAIAKGKSGFYRGKTWEGVDNYTAFETSPFSGLSTHVAIKAGRVTSPARAYLLLMTLAAFTTLALALAIAGFGYARYLERRREEERRRQSQKLEVLGQLAGGVAHDFNNLLMVVIGNLSKLSEMEKDEALRRPISNALAAAERGKQLTQQLLTFTRVQPITIESVDIAAVLEGARDLIAQSVGSQVTVVVDVAEDAGQITSNANELELALLNLAVNARDAMPEGGKLEICVIRSKSAKDKVELIVKDTGQGMPKHVAERALEPFYTTKPAGKGTGLGLAQVLSLVSQSGGTLEIKSQEGAGTAVVLTFPAA